MNLTVIVAVAGHRAIGRGGDLLFHISEDLKRFKSLTMGYPIIMGRKTFESFPRGPLPGRQNVVVTRDMAFKHPGVEVAHSLDQAIALARDAENAFIIGGGEIYRQALPLASRLELTEIDADVMEADTFFPTYDDFSPIATGDWVVDDKSGVRYRFVTLERI